MISGWAVDPNARYRYQVDAAFPLSDHADYTGPAPLRRTGAAETRAHVARLRGGICARSARARRRSLGAERREPARADAAAGNVAAPRRLLPVGRDARRRLATATRLRIRALSPSSAKSIAATPGEAGEGPPARGLSALARRGAAADRDALPHRQSVRAKRSAHAASRLGGDLPRPARRDEAARLRAASHRRAATATRARPRSKRSTAGPRRSRSRSLESKQLFDDLQKARGPIAKTELLQARLAKLSAREGQYVVKILTGDLRIGLREGLVEEAIASAFDAPLDDVKEANMLLGDIGQTALLASRGELRTAELSLFRPIKCMLASPEPTAEAIWARFADNARRRARHLRRGQVRRHPRAAASRSRARGDFLARSAAHDRSIPRTRGARARVRPRSDPRWRDHGLRARTQADVLRSAEAARPEKRRAPILFAAASADVPVVFVAFDLLWLNGRSLLKTPLRERRELLRGLQLAAAVPALGSFAGAFSGRNRGRLSISRAAGMNEGLMVKDPESLYSPGRRGMFWFKLKKELATLDVVVVAAELGHGKRNHVLSDYTFAVRDEATGRAAADRQSLQRTNRRRDRGADRALQTEHDRRSRPLPRSEAGHRAGGRVRFRAAEHAARERPRAALPAHQSDPPRQDRRGDRHARLRAHSSPTATAARRIQASGAKPAR